MLLTCGLVNGGTSVPHTEGRLARDMLGVSTLALLERPRECSRAAASSEAEADAQEDVK